MSNAAMHLEAGGVVLVKAKIDADAAEQIVARSYHHPVLGSRQVVRLASDRLGKAEDLAMEFLGFNAPDVSAPIGIQQRRSLNFGTWALINDPKNAQYALDLVKQMKAAARQARSKPGHAWDRYTEMAKELGRSARQFLPPYWEEVGRAYKDLGNQTYAGRALNKSLEAERVHALKSDQARRRDVVLEFVLAGCLAGQALSDYGNDLQNHYQPAEAFTIFRDLCTRRTRGGLAPWATMAREFLKLAKAAGENADTALEEWLEDVIEAPAMSRPPLQFWKSCSAHCKRIVARNPAFAINLLRHTKPEPRYYGENQVWSWLELLESWGVLEFLWDADLRNAPPLGEPVAEWFVRIIHQLVPVPACVLEMLIKLAPRLKKEGVPIQLISVRYHSSIDIDVLEGCMQLGVAVASPLENQNFDITFNGWLTADVDHQLRNQDLLKSWQDERFAKQVFEGFSTALRCRGTASRRGYGQPEVSRRAFPLAANDRPGVMELWRRYTDDSITALENTGLASFEQTTADQNETLWPDALRLFPDLASRYNQIDPIVTLQKTLNAGIFDEYGWPGLEQLFETTGLSVHTGYNDRNLFLVYPSLVLTDNVHAYVLRKGADIQKVELRLPANATVMSAYPAGDDLQIEFRTEGYQTKLCWMSNPTEAYEAEGYRYRYGTDIEASTELPDGSTFYGGKSVRSGDKQLPRCEKYLHDGQRFWRKDSDYDHLRREQRWKIQEVDPHTGNVARESVPPWFEQTEGAVVDWRNAQLMPLPTGAESTPMGSQDGMTGWMSFLPRDGVIRCQGIDGRTSAFQDSHGSQVIGMLRQPGTDAYLPILESGSRSSSGGYRILAPSDGTVVADLSHFNLAYAWGQATVLPLEYWHFLRVRDEASSKKLRTISRDACELLIQTALADRDEIAATRATTGNTSNVEAARLLAAVNKLLPTAPKRLVTGMTKLVERAMREFNAFREKRETLNKAATEQPADGVAPQSDKIEAGTARWNLPSYHRYGEEASESITTHLAAVVQFFRGKSAAGALPLTSCDWFLMMHDLPLRSWQSYWEVAAEQLRNEPGPLQEWIEFLKFWISTGIAELPGTFHLLVGQRDKSAEDADESDSSRWAGGYAESIRVGDDFFITRRTSQYHYNQPFQILRYSTAAEPGTPPGFAIAETYALESQYDAEEMSQFIVAVTNATSPPIPTKDELKTLAESLSLTTAEIALSWIGGLNLDMYQSNFLPSELRQHLGLKTAEASAARQVFKNLNETVKEQLLRSAISENLAAPFATDRKVALQSLETAWREAIPKRLPVSAEFQKRLSSLSSTYRWANVNHEELLAVAGDAANHTLLKPKKIRIEAIKGSYNTQLQITGPENDANVLTGAFLRSIIQLVSLVQSETPSGHAARKAIPSLVNRVTKLLESPHTLLEVSSVSIYSDGKNTVTAPTWINTHLGKTKTDSKSQMVVYEDEMFLVAAIDGQHQGLITFRTAQLKDSHGLARLRGIEAIIPSDTYNPHGSAVNEVSVARSDGFQKLAKTIANSELEDGQWPQNPLLTAPETVKQIQSKWKLTEPTAMLYAQTLALPDPTSVNVCKWNGWKTSDYKKAAGELVDKQLVLEATRARAGRSIFLAGEWLDLKSPWLPIESWKLPHLYEIEWDLGNTKPMGGPLILRPIDELFVAAWQRVVDGDEPRYEEVKRVVKKSKKKS